MTDTTNAPQDASPGAQLQAVAKALGWTLSEIQQEQLLAYLALLQRWNKVYNLTSVRDPQEMLSLHLADSLAVLPPLRRWLDAHAPDAEPARLLDVGSGAGLPGVVIAICCPDVSVTCVDTVGKKAAFIRQVAASLKLTNLQGLHARVETLTQAYDVVCSRAFSSLVDFTRWSHQALSPQGVWLAMKGKHPEQELAALPASVQVFHVEQVVVPGLQADRCIVWMRKK